MGGESFYLYFRAHSEARENMDFFSAPYLRYLRSASLREIGVNYAVLRFFFLLCFGLTAQAVIFCVLQGFYILDKPS